MNVKAPPGERGSGETGKGSKLSERHPSAPEPSLLAAIAARLVAILELRREEIYSDSEAVRSAIKDAIKVISAYKGGAPDANTLDVLDEAFFLVR